jgi:hypothetical protein
MAFHADPEILTVDEEVDGDSAEDSPLLLLLSSWLFM